MHTTDADSPEAPTKTAAASWNDYFNTIQARYPKVSTPILVALHILTQHPDIALLDAKAQAAVHGVRITAASVSAARRLLQRQTPATVAKTAGKAKTARMAKMVRVPADVFATPPSGFNIEKLVRSTIESIRADADAEAARLREAMQQVVTILQAAIAGTAR
ncbi:MAG: hypothetical protein R3F29_03555 [Planctomycetota bacterium]